MKKIKNLIKNILNICITDKQDRPFYKNTLSKPKFYTSKNLYFHHMVGTGGNSLANTIANYYKPENIFQITQGAILNKSKDKEGKLINPEKYKLGDLEQIIKNTSNSFFYGHNIFNLVDDIRYITLLRNPIQRLISDFYWKAKFDPNYSKLSFFDINKKFIEFIEKEDDLNFYIYHLGDLGYINSQHFNSQDIKKFRKEDQKIKSDVNLKEKFEFIGITELFEASLFILLTEILKIPANKLINMKNHRHPVTEFKLDFLSLPKRIQNHLERKLCLDLDLYEKQKKLFENKIDAVNNEDYKQYYNNEFNEKLY